MSKVHSALILATLTVVSTQAFAQVLVQGGEALDANGRAGSGGYNTQRRDRMLVSPNDVALGNATGGRQFRGNLTPDPSQPFGGRSNLPSDRFARRANPAVTPANPTVRPGNYVQPYYSSAPVGQPPPGFKLDPYTSQYRAPLTAAPGNEDITYGVPPGTPIVRPDGSGGRLVLPSVLRPEDRNSQSPMVLSASPLLGVRELPTLADEERYLLSRSNTPGSQPLDAATLRQLKNDFRQTMLTDPKVAEQIRQAEQQANLAEQKRTGTLAQQPLGSTAQLPTTYLPSPAVRQLPTGVEDTFAPADPSARNPLLAELRKAEADRAKDAKDAKTGKDKPTTKPALRGAGRGTAAGEVPPADPNAAPEEAPTPRPSAPNADPESIPQGNTNAKVGYVKPIQIESLSKGQTEKGLKEVLASAEKLMADGKYASATDRYELARKYAPGDETILVARAHAELAGGFFARGYESLRSAVASDPAVLAAQYDLRKAVGESRLQTIVNDLKKLALDNAKDSRPLAVLAYLSYNAGEEERAISLLDEAAKRNGSGNDDGFVTAMRARWQPKPK